LVASGICAVVTDGTVVGILTQRDLFRAAIASVLELRPAAERVAPRSTLRKS
jgi:CBS domain-containing protein